MVKYFFLLFCSLPLFVFSQNYLPSIKSVLKNTDNTLMSIHSLEYDMLFKDKSLTVDDTMYYNAHVIMTKPVNLAKIPSRYVLAYDIQYEDGSTSSNLKICNGKELFYTNTNDQEDTTSYLHLLSEYSFPNPSFENDLLLKDLFKDNAFLRYHNNMLYRSIIKSFNLDTVIYEHEFCYKLTIKIRNLPTLNSKDNTVVHYIRTKDFLPLGYEMYGRMDDMWDYKSYTIQYKSVNPIINSDVFNIDSSWVINKKSSNIQALLKVDSLKKGMFLKSENDNIVGQQTLLNLEDYRGKIVVLDFWFTGCLPCLKAIPSIITLEETYRDKDVVFIGLNSFDKESTILNFNQKKGIQHITTFGSKPFADKYGIVAYPTTVILDNSGQVYDIIVAWDNNYKRDLEKIIKQLLNK